MFEIIPDRQIVRLYAIDPEDDPVIVVGFWIFRYTRAHLAFVQGLVNAGNKYAARWLEVRDILIAQGHIPLFD